MVHGAMKPLADPIGLRVAHFGLGVLNLLQCQVHLKLMVLPGTPVLSAVVSQDGPQPQLLLLKSG